jgi:hypothetical protein
MKKRTDVGAGKQILVMVSQELSVWSGRAFALRPLYQDAQLRQNCPRHGIVSTLSTQLSWRHFCKPPPLRDMEEIGTETIVIPKEAEGLHGGIIGGERA